MPNSLQDFLKKNRVKFSSIEHPLAYSAREVSHACNISEKFVAKTVICHVGNVMAMIVLPACDTVDFQALQKALQGSHLSLAKENEFAEKFPDCELGAMPPFGNLYNMAVYVDKSLCKNKEIAFNAGTHSQVIKMSCQDFMRLVGAKEIDITHH